MFHLLLFHRGPRWLSWATIFSSLAAVCFIWGRSLFRRDLVSLVVGPLSVSSWGRLLCHRGLPSGSSWATFCLAGMCFVPYCILGQPLLVACFIEVARKNECVRFCYCCVILVSRKSQTVLRHRQCHIMCCLLRFVYVGLSTKMSDCSTLDSHDTPL